jgi:peptidoglycan/xylan/chitin deacetylase (PgdA/CDA1 family)
VILRKTVVSAALKTLQLSGCFRIAAASEARRKRLLILCYHGLSLEDEHEWLPNLYITPEQFRGRLQSLRDMNASVLTLQEGLTRLHSGSLPRRSVVLTFDDGFYDFYKHALPLLKEFSYPATLYLTTHYCGKPIPVITVVLDYLLWKCGLSEVDLSEWGSTGVRLIHTYAERQKVVQDILAWMDVKQLSTSEKSQVAGEIAKRLRVDYDALLRRRILQIITPEEAINASRSGIDLQLHTHRHRTPMDKDLFRREISDNTDVIAALTGHTPVHFCYPSGHYVPEFVPWLRELGVQSATTCDRGLAQVGSPNLTLPRVLDDSTVAPLRFESLVAGLFA